MGGQVSILRLTIFLHRLSELTSSCTFGPVTVQCIRDGQFVVVVSRDVTLPRLSLDSVSFLGGSDPPCGPVDSTPSFAIYQFPVNACGTSMMVSSCICCYSALLVSSP